jgi:hypothetical protein
MPRAARTVTEVAAGTCICAARLSRRAARLTPSLLSRRRPRRDTVAVPQRWTSVSHSRSHAGHQRRSCSVAPSSESISAPPKPPANTGNSRPASPCTVTAVPGSASNSASGVSNAISTAPATSAAVPAVLTPPESPVASGLPVRIERGGNAASVPISVPHVSAVAAA